MKVYDLTYERALKRVQELKDAVPGSPEFAELDQLLIDIEKYERVKRYYKIISHKDGELEKEFEIQFPPEHGFKDFDFCSYIYVRKWSHVSKDDLKRDFDKYNYEAYERIKEYAMKVTLFGHSSFQPFRTAIHWLWEGRFMLFKYIGKDKLYMAHNYSPTYVGSEYIDIEQIKDWDNFTR